MSAEPETESWQKAHSRPCDGSWVFGWRVKQDRESGLKVALGAGICSGWRRLDQVGKRAGKGLVITSPFFYIKKVFSSSAAPFSKPNGDGRDGPRTGTPCPEELGPSDIHGRYPFPPPSKLIRLRRYTNTPFVLFRRFISGTSISHLSVWGQLRGLLVWLRVSPGWYPNASIIV